MKSPKTLEQLLSEIGEKRQTALKEFYSRTSAKLFGVALRICSDHEGAEDVLQRTYLKIWDKAQFYDAAKASPITWACTIAHNTAIDWVRANKRPESDAELSEELPDISNGSDQFTTLEQQQIKAQIAECMKNLEPERAVAIRTAFYEGKSYRQLADSMNVPLGTMKSWIRRSMALLRKCLDGVK